MAFKTNGDLQTRGRRSSIQIRPSRRPPPPEVRREEVCGWRSSEQQRAAAQVQTRPASQAGQAPALPQVKRARGGRFNQRRSTSYSSCTFTSSACCWGRPEQRPRLPVPHAVPSSRDATHRPHRRVLCPSARSAFSRRKLFTRYQQLHGHCCGHQVPRLIQPELLRPGQRGVGDCLREQRLQ